MRGEEIFFPGILGEDGSGIAIASPKAINAQEEANQWAEQWDKENHGNGLPGVILYPQIRDGVKGHALRRYIFNQNS